MDRVGKATDYNFSVISHAEPVDLIIFSLRKDNFCWAVGKEWQRLFAIPMGGSFNAQSANLYCIWSFHLLKTRSRQWGTLSTSPQGYPMWTSPTRWILALKQFHDNILVVSAGLRASSTVCVCVCVCVCVPYPQRCLEFACPLSMYAKARRPVHKSLYGTGPSCSRYMHASGVCTCVAHPSAFTKQWNLKPGPPLQFAWAIHDVNLANLCTSVLVNALPFTCSWGSLLSSCAVWINMGLLCSHMREVTLRVAHRALTRVAAGTPYAVEPNRKCPTHT